MLRFILTIVALFAGFTFANESGPVVTTTSGKIQGFVDESTKGKSFYTFHKIPFAEPPVGKLRFKNPKLIKQWKGIRDGSQQPVSCPGIELFTYLTRKIKSYEGQEDCLHLSIYTPKIEEKLLPVLFFIHGGGFVSSHGAMYSGHELMNEDVVYVSINYRLGVLGFISTEDEVIPGNLGLKDQTMALRWVHENIKYFGGDPTKVTIFGESAGGASVHFHLLSPASKNYFNRAIMQSGNALCLWSHTEDKKSVAYDLANTLGCSTHSNIEKNINENLIECLQEFDAETLTLSVTKYFEWNLFPIIFNPYIDGTYLPDHPETLIGEGRYNDVDIMIGITRDDGGWFSQQLYDDIEEIKLMKNEFNYYGPISLGFSRENSSEVMAEKVFHHYLGNVDFTKENAEQVTQMFTDIHFKICSDIASEMHSTNMKSSEKNVYSYQLDYKGQRSASHYHKSEFVKHWITHTDDLFYLFPMDTMPGLPEKSADDKKMTEIFTKLWTNFAATGNPTPNSTLGFSWENYNKEYPKHLSLKLEPEMKLEDKTEIRKLWSSLPLHQNKLLSGLKVKKDGGEKSEL